MRKLLFLIVCSIFFSSPAVAENNNAAEVQRGNRDECLLVAKNCPQPNYNLREQIQRLKDEIDKGTSVYTPEELRMLMRKRDEATATKEFFEQQAPSMQY